MGNIRLYGSTSGYTELAPPAVAPDGVLSLPSGVGTLLTAEGGKVLQVVRATDTTNRTTTSTSFTDVTGMSVTITPQKNDSVIIIIANFLGWLSSSSPSNIIGQFQITDSSNNGISGAQQHDIGSFGITFTTADVRTSNALFAYATPATTSPVTYKLRFKSDSATVTTTCRNGTGTGQMFAIEVSA